MFKMSYVSFLDVSEKNKVWSSRILLELENSHKSIIRHQNHFEYGLLCLFVLKNIYAIGIEIDYKLWLNCGTCILFLSRKT